jgi:hypothetical protein
MADGMISAVPCLSRGSFSHTSGAFCRRSRAVSARCGRRCRETGFPTSFRLPAVPPREPRIESTTDAVAGTELRETQRPSKRMQSEKPQSIERRSPSYLHSPSWAERWHWHRIRSHMQRTARTSMRKNWIAVPIIRLPSSVAVNRDWMSRTRSAVRGNRRATFEPPPLVSEGDPEHQ